MPPDASSVEASAVFVFLHGFERCNWIRCTFVVILPLLYNSMVVNGLQIEDSGISVLHRANSAA